MSANILTPLLLWRNFSLDRKARTEIVSTKQTATLTLQKLYIDGRSTKQGTVKAYCVSARPKDLDGDLPTVIVFTGDGMEEEKIASYIAKNGYYAFVVNMYGKKEGKESFTIYPDDISYANYEECKDHLQKVKKDVKHTCWYEWSALARYVYNAVKGMDGVGRIGAVGIKEYATPVWHLSANEELSCMATLFGFGWETNRGIYKFGDETEPKFSDEALMFVAGVEAESYAMHVKCPSMVLTSTNHRTCDVDRAHDTLSKIKEGIHKIADYSVNYTHALSQESLSNLEKFFDLHLRGDMPTCSTKCEIHAEVKMGKVLFELLCDDACVNDAELYVAEQIVDPKLRCWKRIISTVRDGGKFNFEYLPYAESERVMYFAKIKNGDGLTFCSPITCKKFLSSEIIVSNKSNVIYSGRDENAESVFAPYDETGKLVIKADFDVVEKGGPMGIKGMYSALGVQTFRINAKKYRPKDDAILMFDAYSKGPNVVTVKLIVDGEYKTVYKTSKEINGGRLWYNFKFEKAKFKTNEGMILKSYEKVTRIVFEFENSGLINNVLWV